MPRLKTEQVRVPAYDLTRALRAAAAFTDVNKKSHRHRICLRTAMWTDDTPIPTQGGNTDTTGEKSALIAAAGGPLRCLSVLAGETKTFDEFAVDITPGAAALIVKLFSAAGEVELKHDGKTLTVTATDALFDNRRIEVRALKPEARSDALLITQRIAAITSHIPMAISITHEASVAIAAAAKALGAPVAMEPISHGKEWGAELQYASVAVGYTRAHLTRASLAPAWDAILEQELIRVDDPWAGDMVTLQHLIDGALPRRAVTVLPGGQPAEPDGEPIDLDAIDIDQDGVETFASALLQRGSGTALTDADGTLHVNVTIPAADAFADEEAIA
jgi:hypothetical protein